MVEARKLGIPWLLAVGVCLTMTISPMWAKEGKGKGKSKAHGPAKTRIHAEVDIFGDADREVIREYFTKSPGNLPPGLAKRGGNLPPGLEKQLHRNGRLPPGLEKKIAPFPVELEGKLSPLKGGLRRGIIEGRAVIYHRKNALVLDSFSVF